MSFRFWESWIDLGYPGISDPGFLSERLQFLDRLAVPGAALRRVAYRGVKSESRCRISDICTCRGQWWLRGAGFSIPFLQAGTQVENDPAA